MREITYTYEVKEVDTFNRKIKVEYNSYGRETTVVEIPFPFVNDDVELIIQQYAPVFGWIAAERTLAEVQVGKKGLITTHFPDFE